MSTDAKNSEILERATAATTKRIKIRLDEVKFDLDRYCHRDPEALSEENLASLMQSLTLEGLQVPIEGFRDSQGNFITTKGHRRITSCRLLAGRNTPGFTLEMELEALEVLDATLPDLLVRSIADNEVRLNLDRVSRIRVAKKLYDAGVQVERAYRAMGTSEKTYMRDVLIARHSWMFQHVIDDSIAPTPAYDLLSEAEKAARIKELKEDLDEWIAGKKRKIRDKERLKKAQDGKELRPADKQVKKFMPPHLVTHWLDLIRNGKRFDEDAQWTFAASIEKDSEQLKISSVTLDLSKASLEQLAKIASKFSQLAKQLVPYIKHLREVESRPGGLTSEEAAYDLEYLRQLGLNDIADDLEEQVRQAGKPDGEADPSREQQSERTEQELTDQIQLPGASEPGPTAEAPPAQAPKEPRKEDKA